MLSKPRGCRVSAASCWKGSRASCAKASARWRRSRASRSFISTDRAVAAVRQSHTSPTRSSTSGSQIPRARPMIDSLMKEIGIEGRRARPHDRSSSRRQRHRGTACSGRAKAEPAERRASRPATRATTNAEGTRTRMAKVYSSVVIPAPASAVVGDRARLQRSTEIGTKIRGGEPDRTQRAGRQGRVHSGIFASNNGGRDPRAAPGAVRL